MRLTATLRFIDMFLRLGLKRLVQAGLPLLLCAGGSAPSLGASYPLISEGVGRTLILASDAAEPAAATPVFEPAGGTYSKTLTVKLSCATPSATIYYALHGATPTAASTKYTGPIKVNSTRTIKAIAIAKGYKNSAVAEAKYTVDLPLTAKPVFSPPGGAYKSIQKVTISDATAGADIYFTTDGTAPTTKSERYSRAITVTGHETLQAIATAPEHKPSDVASARYAIELSTSAPVFHPDGGDYSKAQRVTITDATPGAAIYYTTDKSTPTIHSTRYTGAITVPVSPHVQTIHAIAIKEGFSASTVALASFTITPLVATPVFYPAGGTYSSSVSISITDSTANSAIYYTTNGHPPTTASTLYKSPIEVSATETLQAIAVSGVNLSAVASASFTITSGVTAPATISTAPALNGAVIVTLRSNSAGAAIYYTVDGSEPTASSTPYLAPFLVASNLTVKTIAIASGDASSPVTEQTFEPEIPSGTLVWSEEFTNKSGANAQPNPHVWTYDTGISCCGNNEWEDYCAWGSSASPCDPRES